MLISSYTSYIPSYGFYHHVQGAVELPSPRASLLHLGSTVVNVIHVDMGFPTMVYNGKSD